MDIRIVVLGLIALVPDDQSLQVLLVDATQTHPPPLATDGCTIEKHKAEISFTTKSACDVEPCKLDGSLCRCTLDGHQIELAGLDYGAYMGEALTRRALAKFPGINVMEHPIARREVALRPDYTRFVAAETSLPVLKIEPCIVADSERFLSCRFEPLTVRRMLPIRREVAEAATLTVRAEPKLTLTGASSVTFDLKDPLIILSNEMDFHDSGGRCGHSGKVDEEIGRHFELFYDLLDRPRRDHFQRRVPYDCHELTSRPPKCPALLGLLEACNKDCAACGPLAQALCRFAAASGPPICTMAVF